MSKANSIDKLIDALVINDEVFPFSEKEKIAFFEMEQKARQYAMRFFKILSQVATKPLRDDILPVVCRDQVSESILTGLSSIRPSLTYNGLSGKQAVVYINLPRRQKYSYLSKKIKADIRHEVIHYFLWLNDLPFEDDTALFWAYCLIYNGKAYQPLPEAEETKYNRFKDWYASSETAMISYSAAQKQANEMCLDRS